MRRAKNKKSLFKKAVLKMLSLLMAGIFTSMIAMAYLDTYSWFTSNMTADMRVSAATTDTIISLFEIDEKNPKEIRVQRAAGLNYSPVVYFEAGGAASSFLRHINPAELSTAELYTLGITVNVTLEQLISLIFNDSVKEFPGWISLKYLNKYIVWDREYKFTRKYLISEGLKNVLGIGFDLFSAMNAESEDLNAEEADNALVRLALYIASLRDWEAGGANMDLPMMADGYEKAMPGRVTLNEDQIAMINTIAPALLAYAEELYGEYTSLLEKYSSETGSMKETIEKLEGEIAELKSLIGSLEEQLKKQDGEGKGTDNEGEKGIDGEDKGLDGKNGLDNGQGGSEQPGGGGSEPGQTNGSGQQTVNGPGPGIPGQPEPQAGNDPAPVTPEQPGPQAGNGPEPGTPKQPGPQPDAEPPKDNTLEPEPPQNSDPGSEPPENFNPGSEPPSDSLPQADSVTEPPAES